MLSGRQGQTMAGIMEMGKGGITHASALDAKPALRGSIGLLAASELWVRPGSPGGSTHAQILPQSAAGIAARTSCPAGPGGVGRGGKMGHLDRPAAPSDEHVWMVLLMICSISDHF